MTDSESTEEDGSTAGRNVTAARERVIEAMASSAEVYGAKRSYGRLFGILYFADEPLSMDELVERSGYAKSTVSTAMSTLERFKMVNRRSIPGEGKRAFFEAENDLWYVFQKFLDNEARREVETMTRALDEAEKTLAETDSEQAGQDLERIRQLKEMYDQCDVFIDVFTESSLEELVAMAEYAASDLDDS